MFGIKYFVSYKMVVVEIGWGVLAEWIRLKTGTCGGIF
jgi:hypothetical protein